MKLSCHRPSLMLGIPGPPQPVIHMSGSPWLLICALLRWGSVGKHLFPRHSLLHLSGVTASACKQGGANCLSLSFYGTKAEQTNKPENFTQQPVKHSHSATGDKCYQVPSAACTHGNMLTWKQMCIISHIHTMACVLCSTCDMTAKTLVIHHIICGSIKVPMAAFGLVFKDCFSQ